MKQYLTNAINNSPTIPVPAAADMNDIGGKAVKFDEEGNCVLCDTVGEMCLGIVTIDNPVEVKKGATVSVQIKDMGRVVAGAAIPVGAELTVDAEGTFIPAEAGQYVRAIAKQAAAAKGEVIPVIVVNYVSAGGNVKKN